MLQSGPSSNIPHETDTAISVGPDGTFNVPDGFMLFSSEFGRDGADVLVQDPSGAGVRLVDFFADDLRADVLSPDGASLAGRVVERLAGPLFPGQYAQSGAVAQADAIGQVETVGGDAFAQRTDGTIVQLEVGTKVFQGDVVRTDQGSTLGLTFTDGTIFTLASGSRMVLDELIYDPQSTDNSGIFDLVEGGFVFIAGQAAGTGGIEINTPAATMGIRGTTVRVDIQTTNGVATVTVSLNPDPDGGTGAIELFDLSGDLITTITNTDTKWIIRPPFTNEPPIEVERFAADLSDDAVLLSQAVAAFQSAVARVARGETFVELDEGDGDAPVDDTAPDTDLIEDGTDGTEETPPPPPLDETGDGNDAGESGSGNPELDGTDEPLPENDTQPTGDDDAGLDVTTGGTEIASNGNGAPEIAPIPIRSVEDTPITGRLPVTDRDGDAFEVTLVRGALNGSVVLDTDGVFTYTPDPDFEGTDSFIVTAQDSEGAISESEISVVVDGVNDAPVVDFARAEGSAFETGLTAGEVSGRATGRVTFSDVDETSSAPGVWSIAAAASNTTVFGAISIDTSTGEWAYDLDQAAADVLAQDQTVVETFIASVTDAGGAVDTTTVEVTLTGSNDGPVITSDAPVQTLSESITGFNTLEPVDEEAPDPVGVEGDGPADAGSVTGALSFFDVDQGDTPGQWSVAADGGNTTALGAISIDAPTGVWVYTLDERAADVLGNGDMVTETFTATVTDAFGATASQQIAITVTGFNDAPTIEFSIEDIEATVFEDGFDPDAADSALPAFRFAAHEGADASGTLRYTDPDGEPGDIASWSVTPDGPSLGVMEIDALTGEWHYVLDEAAAQSLREGEEVIETFTATVTDLLGAAAEQTITITVIGSNDASEIIATAQDLTGAAADGGISTASGTLTFVDPDAAPGEIALWSVTPVGDTRGSMTIEPETGAWLYTLDQALADSLGEGAQVDEFFTARLTDALGATSDQIITITLTGENDAPVITQAQSSGSVVEAGATGPGTPQATGDITAVDPDADGAIPIWTLVADATNATAFGAMTINPVSGTWTYTLDEAAAQALTTGDSFVERFVATVTDPFGGNATQDIDVTIEGTNDAPVVLNGSGTALEGGAQVTVDLSALASDVDAGEDGSTLIYALVGSPAQGSAQIVGTDLIFTPGSDFAALAAGETTLVVLNLTATDAGGAIISGSVTVTVTGTNGAPELAGASLSLSEDTGQITLDLSSLGSDPDAGEDGSTLIYTIASAPAAGSASINGTALSFGTDGAFDTLGQGETRTVAITVTAADAAGETATAIVDVTVTGTNDAPEITQATAVTIGAVREAGTITGTATATGQLAYTDADETTPGDAVWTIAPQNSPFGAISIGAASGDWLYTLDNSAADSLNAGETRSESFTATITDADGLSDTQDITVTVTGSNDAPSLTAQTTGLLEDEAAITVDLRANATDPDSDDTSASLSFALLTQPASGAASVTGGTLRFSTDSAFEGLASGEIRTVFVDVEVRDAQGGTGVSTYQFDVTGTNDAPIIDLAGSTIAGTAFEPTTEFDAAGGPDATGTLAYIDLDEPANAPGTWSVAPNGSGFGSLEINAATGAWSYVVDSDATDILRQGATVEDRYTATITDADGATATQEITLTITGTNDRPEVIAATSVTAGSHTEEGALTVTGQVFASDPDDTVAAPTWRIDVDTELGGNVFGTISINAATGVWSYTANPTAILPLGEGDTEVEHYTATITDEFGATDTIAVAITIIGTNTAPEIIATAGQIIGTVVEAGALTPGTSLARATLDYSDIDEGDTLGTWSVTASDPAQFGTATIGAASGQWVYTLSQVLADSLGAGQVATDTFSVIYTDADGAASAPQQIAITVQGSNDLALISGATSSAVFEDGGSRLITTGNLNHTDVDANNADDTWQTATNAASDAGFGTYQITSLGVWTYTLNNANPTVDALRGGETVQDTFTAMTQDGTPQVVTITINGANDAPGYVSGPPTGAAIEDGDITTFDLLTGAVDPDTGETATLSIENITGLVPGITAVGSIITIDPTNAEFQSIPGEDSRTITLSYDIVDVSGGRTSETTTIEIDGRNDRPTLLAGSVSANEDAGPFTLDLSTLADDADDGEDGTTLSYTVFSPPAFGTASISGTILTLTPGTDFDDLAVGEERIVNVSVFALDGNESSSTPADMQFTITGENDTPDITVTSNLTLAEAAGETGNTTLQISDSVSWTFTDADLSDIGHTTEISGIGFSGPGTPGLPAAMSGYLGFTTDKTVGSDTGAMNITFSAPDADFDYLSVGESVILEYQLTVNDGDGGLDAETFTVTIAGTNDAPEIIGSSIGGFIEAPDTSNSAAINTVFGVNTFIDRDLSDIGHTTTVTNLSTTGSIAGLPATSVLLDYFTLNTTKDAGMINGFVSWSFAAPDSAFDYLTGVESVVLTYEMTVNDGDGGTAVVSTPITIQGSNDLPFYSTPLGNFAGDEDSGVQSFDLLAGAVDLDNGETPGILGIGGLGAGSSIIGSQLTVDFSNAAFQVLSEGASSTVVVNYALTDGSGSGATVPAAVNVVLTGVNDAPTLAAGTGAGTADAASIDVNLIPLGDDIDSEDDGSTLTYAIIAGPAEGSAVIALDGTTLQFDPGSDFLDLGSGNSRNVTVQIQATDTRLATSTVESVVITVNGITTPATISGDTTGSVVEDILPGTASGDLDSVDPDIGDADDAWNATTGPVATTYGTYEIGTDGMWDYTLSNGSAAVNALDDGDTVFDIFTVNTTDGTPQDITITITGSNDDADITGALGVAVNEVGFTGSISGNLFSTDLDADDANNSWTVVSVPTATASGEGTFTLSALGVWTYAANPLNPAIDGLNDPPGAAIDIFNDSFIISTADGTTQQITIEIQGFNDAATIGGVITGSVDEDDVNDTISGIATSMDVDNTDDAFLVQGATATLSGRGTFSVNAGGTWSYTLNNANTEVNELTGGETLGDLFTIASEDGTQQTITITITGNDDLPVIGGDVAGSLFEDDPNDIFTGNLTITDPDGPAQTWVAQSGVTSPLGAGFSINAAGQWNYSIDNGNATIDALDAGETTDETFVVTTTEGVNQTLTVTITGVNDAPETTLDIQNITLNAPIDTTQPAWTEFNGHFYQFIDLPTGLTWSDAQIAANATGGYLANVTTPGENAFLVTLSGNRTGWIGGTDADVEDVWIWSQGPEAGQQFFQGAAVGDGGTGVGGFYTNWRQTPLVEPNEGAENALQFTNDGTWNNLVDSPAQILDYFLEYSGPPAFRGSLVGNVTDAEGDGLTFTSLVVGPSALTINLDGTWVLDQTHPDFTEIADSELAINLYPYQVSDGTSTTTGNLQFNFTGINDAAVITGDTSGTIFENVAGGSLTRNLNHTDIDNNNTDDLWTAITGGANGSFGNLTMTAAGVWTYTLEDNIAVNSLNVGDTRTDTFTVETQDGTTQDISVTILGQDDPATITDDIGGAVVEDVTASFTGDLNHIDVDNTNQLFNAVTGGATANGYGTFDVTAAGGWTYTLDNGNAAVDALDNGDPLTDTFVVTTTGGTPQTVLISITGTTDAPPLTANNDSGAIEAINVMVVGVDASMIAATRDQLNLSNAGNGGFDFNVSIRGITATTLWNASTLDGIDVVVLGGDEGLTDLDAQISYGFIEDFYNAGGNVVTTGGILTQYSDVGQTTQDQINAVTPVADQTLAGGTTNAFVIAREAAGITHPIFDDIPNFTLTQSPFYATTQLDASGVSILASLNVQGGTPTVAIKPTAGGPTDPGNAVFIGGPYLGSDQIVPPAGSLELRTGVADQLLEQAIAWAAGVQKIEVNEDVPFTFLSETLLANDVNAESATITGVSQFSAQGATIRLNGGNVDYDPTSSRFLDGLINGGTDTDSFTYTITDGGNTSTATVNLTVNGITDTDAPPVFNLTSLDGFSAQDSSLYDFDVFRYSDVGGAGMQYVVQSLAAPNADLPDGFAFNPGTNSFSVMSAATVSYREDLILNSYEADGQSAVEIFGYSVDSTGDLRFVFTRPAGTTNGTLEIAFDDAVGSGNVAGDGELVDLSAIDTFAPNVLARVSVLDLRNGQENELLLDTGDLLNLIEGNDTMGVANEFIVIEKDLFDTVTFVDDVTPGSEGWNAVSQAGDPRIYDIINTGGPTGAFADFSANFATIFVDDGGMGPT